MHSAIEPIALIESPYKQKFAIPRQPRLIEEATARCVFLPNFNREEFVRGLEEFSHIWLIFQFHETIDKGWSPLVRPPRLGGNEKKGVFATRATHRPNGLGMSAVKLDKVNYERGQLWLDLTGIDLLDGTPIIDIKPYLPYSDSLPNATAGFADTRPETELEVSFSQSALTQCNHYQNTYPNLQQFIVNVLKQDPRPAYKKNRSGVQDYAMTLYDLNIRWQVIGRENKVTEISAIDSDTL